MLSTFGTTIIISTHYIEETRFSNKIGFLRNGKLLVEDTPANMLETFECELIQDVILKLCHAKQSCNEDQRTKSYEHKQKTLCVATSTNETSYQSYKSNLGYADNKKNMETNAKCIKMPSSLISIYGYCVVLMLAFIRLPMFLVMLLCLPTIQVVLTMVTLGCTMNGMRIGIVNLENAENWKVDCSLPKHSVNACDFSMLSCKYLNHLQEGDRIILESYQTEAQALEQVTLGGTWGYILIPKNYTVHLLDFLEQQRFSLNETLEGSRIHARLDQSQYIAAFLTIRHIYDAFGKFIEDLAVSCNIGREKLGIPIQFRPPIYGTYDDNFAEFILPGVVNCTFAGVVAFVTALLFIYDKNQGTLRRAQVTGLTPAEVVASHLITQAVIIIVQFIVLTAVLYAVYPSYMHNSLWVYMTFCALLGIYSAELGITLGIVAHNEVQVLACALFLAPIFLLFGDVIFPAELMPKLWQYIGYAIPTKLPTQALRSVMIRGLDWSHPLVLPGFGVLILKVAALMVCSLMAYRLYLK